MADDCTDGLDRELPELEASPPDLLAPDPILSELVTRPNAVYPLTAREDRDVHSAITSGLGSYLLTLDDAVAGRSTRIESVIWDWADRDDGSRPLPSAAVHSEEDGKYLTETGMAPGRPRVIEDDPPVQLTESAIYALDLLTVEVVTGDKIMRAGVRRMLENAFWPFEWKAGFRLVLPQYHNAIATFLPLTAQFADDEQSTMAGMRRLVFRLRARCPVYKVHRLALAKPRAIDTGTS